MDGKTETVTHDEVHNGVTPKKGGIMNTLYPPGPKPGAVPRVKNHCRKFWWCGEYSRPSRVATFG